LLVVLRGFLLSPLAIQGLLLANQLQLLILFQLLLFHPQLLRALLWDLLWGLLWDLLWNML
jgi:hypothetical protein